MSRFTSNMLRIDLITDNETLYMRVFFKLTVAMVSEADIDPYDKDCDEQKYRGKQPLVLKPQGIHQFFLCRSMLCHIL